MSASRAETITRRNEQERADAVAGAGCPKCFATPGEECTREGVKSLNPHLQRIARYRTVQVLNASKPGVCDAVGHVPECASVRAWFRGKSAPCDSGRGR